MFIYWMGECDVVDSNKERKIDYDLSMHISFVLNLFNLID